MPLVRANHRISVKNILFLTDFSEPSTAALPFATMIARAYGAKVTALHVLLPSVYEYMAAESGPIVRDDQEDLAKAEMDRVEAELAGVPREAIIARGINVWEVQSRIFRQHSRAIASARSQWAPIHLSCSRSSDWDCEASIWTSMIPESVSSERWLLKAKLASFRQNWLQNCSNISPAK